MKNFRLVIIGVLALVVGGLVLATAVLAQEAATPTAAAVEEPIYTPRLLPDSPFYFLKRIKERIELFLARAPEARAEKQAELATRRVAEAKQMVKKGKPEFVEKLLARHQKHLDQAMAKVEEAKERGRKVERLIEIVTQATSQHQSVLVDVYEKVPEPAKEAIEKAVEVSQQGQERALEAISGEKREALKGRVEEKIGPKKEKIKEMLKGRGRR